MTHAAIEHAEKILAYMEDARDAKALYAMNGPTCARRQMAQLRSYKFQSLMLDKFHRIAREKAEARRAGH